MMRSGTYGRNYDHRGVVTDHVPDAIADGWRTHVSPSGRTWLVSPDGLDREPVLCGELVEVWTEDGPTTGRCGLPVMHDSYACPGHTAELDAWRAMTEPERSHWEHNREDT